ncbi:MAG TPA: hypothetical protein V6C65_01225 [Allocoleopsis sp.]
MTKTAPIPTISLPRFSISFEVILYSPDTEHYSRSHHDQQPICHLETHRCDCTHQPIMGRVSLKGEGTLACFEQQYANCKIGNPVYYPLITQ